MKRITTTLCGLILCLAAGSACGMKDSKKTRELCHLSFEEFPFGCGVKAEVDVDYEEIDKGTRVRASVSHSYKVGYITGRVDNVIKMQVNGDDYKVGCVTIGGKGSLFLGAGCGDSFTWDLPKDTQIRQFFLVYARSLDSGEGCFYLIEPTKNKLLLSCVMDKKK